MGAINFHLLLLVMAALKILQNGTNRATVENLGNLALHHSIDPSGFFS